MPDRHPGRTVFNLRGNPDKSINLIYQHGTFARIMQARLCPCQSNTDSSSGYTRLQRLCPICNGSRYIYEFQRKLLQADEDSPNMRLESVIEPWRTPILEVVSVESVPEIGTLYAGQNNFHTVKGFGPDFIELEADNPPPPKKHQKKIVSYYFDRFENIIAESPAVDTTTKSMTVTGTKELSVNWLDIHGDITIIDRLYNADADYTYDNAEFSFAKNRIQIHSGPDPVAEKMEVDYWYAPATQIAPADLRSSMPQDQMWTTSIERGETRMALLPWFRVAEGDLITLLTVEMEREAGVVKSENDYEILPDFDVGRIDQDIHAVAEDGTLDTYRPNQHFILYRYNQIKWIASARPAVGATYMVRYTYRPTWVVYVDQAERNNLENKQYPQTVNVKLYSGTSPKERNRIASAAAVYPDNRTNTALEQTNLGTEIC